MLATTTLDTGAFAMLPAGSKQPEDRLRAISACCKSQTTVQAKISSTTAGGFPLCQQVAYNRT